MIHLVIGVVHVEVSKPFRPLNGYAQVVNYQMLQKLDGNPQYMSQLGIMAIYIKLGIQS